MLDTENLTDEEAVALYVGLTRALLGVEGNDRWWTARYVAMTTMLSREDTWALVAGMRERLDTRLFPQEG